MKSRIFILIIIIQLQCMTGLSAAIADYNDSNPAGNDFQSQKESSNRSLPGGMNRFVFSYGLGGGISFVSAKTYDPEDPWNNSRIRTTYLKPCFSSNLRIGYAPSEKFFICWNAKSNFFREILSSEPDNTEWLAGGGAGIGILFFPFGADLPLYITGQFGYSNLFKGFHLDINNFGTEIGAGAGYVILKNFSVELSLQLGTSEKSYYNGSVSNPLILNFTFNYIFWKLKKT